MRQFLTAGFHCDFMGFNKALKDALLLPRAMRGVARRYNAGLHRYT